ncbi:hypothetical protein ACIQU4_38970 [Streptomyces sp. NPDC090741]|uniref:hypothetical protein n=1 Tax=Streptomyces sp. NPDC090741 TaxID=3365967 RepID=UPI0038092A06
MKISRQRVAGVMAGVTLLCTAGMSPAHAEGTFDTYISNWYVSNESRHWTDRNSDGAWTGVYFEGCSTDAGFNHAGLMLRKAVDWQPDPSKGSRTNYCGWVDWNDPDDAGQYYFVLESLNSGSRLWVNKVTVGF